MNNPELIKVVGATLWWAEGTKSRRDSRWARAVTYPIEITSTDPTAVAFFLRFLREVLQIDEKRLKVQLQIHANDSRKDLERFWSEVSGVPLERFHKTIVRPIGIKIGKTRGTCKIRYHDKPTYLKAKSILDDLIELVKVK